MPRRGARAGVEAAGGMAASLLGRAGVPIRRRYKIRVPTRRYFSQSVVFQAVHTVTLDLILTRGAVKKTKLKQNV